MLYFTEDTVISMVYETGDEFTSNKVDTSQWRFTPGSHTIFNNKEQQYYTEGENHLQEDGILQLVARRDSVLGKAVDWMNDKDSLIAGGKFYTLNKRWFTFTSGELQHRSSFLYGYYEARVKLPKTHGFWPAFWLYGGFPNEEIDILEARSSKPRQIYINTHCADQCDRIEKLFGGRSFGGRVKIKADLADSFHIISCLWLPNEIRFFFDGHCAGVSPVKFSIEKNLVVNLAVPSDDGPFGPGPLSNETAATFSIDFVRVWKERDLRTRTFSANNLGIELLPIGTYSKGPFKGRLRKYIRGTLNRKKQEILVFCVVKTDSLLIQLQGPPDNGKFKATLWDTNNLKVWSGNFSNSIAALETSRVKPGQYILKLQLGRQSASLKIVF